MSGVSRTRAELSRIIGVKFVRACELTGSFVVLYSARAQGLDESDGKYALSCEEHGSLLSIKSVGYGRSFAAISHEWCEGCRKLYTESSDSLVIVVPDSIVRLFQMDDQSIRNDVYDGAFWRSSKRTSCEFLISLRGARQLQKDLTEAADGHWDGGSPLENANVVRSAAAYLRKLTARLGGVA